MRIPGWALLFSIPLLASCSLHGEFGASAPVGVASMHAASPALDSTSVLPANIPTGAVTAIFDYFRLLNLALATGRTKELVESVAWDCPCLTPVPAIREIYRDGRLIDSVRTAATQIIDSTGASRRLEARANHTDFLLEEVGGEWLIMSSKKP